MKLSLAAALLGALAVSAQTSTECNPLKQKCPADPALAGSADFGLTSESPRFHATGGTPTYGKDGASLTIGKRFDAPKLTSDFYIMFGYVEWEIKAAPGKGIVSSAVLLSDCLDEIDWEFLGGDPNQVQSNFFGKGDTTTYDRVKFHPAPNNNQEFHKYAVDWTADKTTFYIDGQTVRELTPDAAKGQYPQTPMRVLAGSWAGGDPSNNQGTIEWAGGETDFSQVPFTMFVKSIKVTDYSTGKEYVYKDMTGKWESIQAVDGKVNKSGKPGSGPKVESSTLPSSPSTSAHAPVPTVPGGGIGNPQAPSTGPSPTLTNGPSSTKTSLIGLPSSWIVTETGTGGVVTPTSAAESTSHHSDYTSRSSRSVSSSVSASSGNGGHDMTTSTGSGSAPTGTGSLPGSPGSGSGSAPGYPVPTGTSGGGSNNPTDGGASPTDPAMQAPGSTGAIHSVSNALLLSFCAIAAWALV